MRLFIIAGEKSGDQHAGEVVKGLLKADNNSKIFAYGGDSLKQAGAELIQHYSGLAFMGLDFLFSLTKVIKVFRKCQKDIIQSKADALLLVDFSGFNLRIAAWANRQKIPVYYYIPPKTWAWNSKRNQKLRKYCKQVFAILPFEASYFQQELVDVKYVGNPTLEILSKFKKEEKEDYIALLPGSRVGEVKRMVPLLNKIGQMFPYQKFKVAALSEIRQGFYEPFKSKNIELCYDNSFELIQKAKLAVVTSGTATLETAILDTPQVVVYRTSKMVYKLVKSIIKIKYISLVNLILDKMAVKEFIQDDYQEEELFEEINSLLLSAERRQEILQDYRDMQSKLGDKQASVEVARHLLSDFKK